MPIRDHFTGWVKPRAGSDSHLPQIAYHPSFDNGSLYNPNNMIAPSYPGYVPPQPSNANYSQAPHWQKSEPPRILEFIPQMSPAGSPQAELQPPQLQPQLPRQIQSQLIGNSGPYESMGLSEINLAQSRISGPEYSDNNESKRINSSNATPTETSSGQKEFSVGLTSSSNLIYQDGRERIESIPRGDGDYPNAMNEKKASDAESEENEPSRAEKEEKMPPEAEREEEKPSGAECKEQRPSEAGVVEKPITAQPQRQRWNQKLKPLPPTSRVVEPFGGLMSPGVPPLLPKGLDILEENSTIQDDVQDTAGKPTCSLNLICYSKGCSMGQIIVTTRERFANDEQYQRALSKTPTLVSTDGEFFQALRNRYSRDMCGFWQRYFSLKTLRSIRLLSYTEATRPTPVPLDDFTMQEVLYAYNHPSNFGPETDWVEWVFRLRQPDKRHALEFVEGWNGMRIGIAGTIPCIASSLVGIIWSARGGDVQTAFTVAGFILTIATVLLALLAVISGIDSTSHQTRI
ncbi:uncharacterized protein BDR25DRAFT_39049 [Lindgomyces ingoldianus]|uniref:Uncharacterized protein n=1 Tax=Lindgomyces ingoldianus TaxID=673940 RepID=A0ACB6QRW1_9PLEO|nr:uncharacterized protein BDR25DRAFT_39049 [Lindgomyces ingoldianus]KAF2469734.1 hypothetical protein BDR25DRAFT_39049 [Lindgomyces ingoldianus]